MMMIIQQMSMDDIILKCEWYMKILITLQEFTNVENKYWKVKIHSGHCVEAEIPYLFAYNMHFSCKN